MQILSKNEKQTYSIAKKFAKTLTPTNIVLLEGDLGSGKTVFARGIAAGLKIKGSITSPTFTIYNHYSSKKSELFHFDLYRIDSLEEALNFGIDEIISSKSIKIFEWPEIIKPILPDGYIQIKIEKIDDTKRKIEIN